MPLMRTEGHRARGAAAAAVLLLLCLWSSPDSAWGHPEAGDLHAPGAETEYKILVDLNPKDIGARNKLGTILYHKNKLKEAEAAFAEVLRRSPANFDAHDGMGLVRMKERKYEEAIAWFRKGISINPDDTLVHFNLGMALEQTGKLKEAEAACKRSLEINAVHIRKGVNREFETATRGNLVAALTRISNRLKGGK